MSAIASDERGAALPRSIRDFETWAPLLAIPWLGDQHGLSATGGRLAGRVDREGLGFSAGPGQELPPFESASRVVAQQLGIDPMARVQQAFADAGTEHVSFTAEYSASGKAVLHLLEFGPAGETVAETILEGDLSTELM